MKPTYLYNMQLHPGFAGFMCKSPGATDPFSKANKEY